MEVTWDSVKEQFFGDPLRTPQAPIPVIEIKPETLETPPKQGLRAMWIGHAGVLIEIDGHRFLIDPVFSEYASPFDYIGPKRFHPPPVALKDLINIDAVMISHDHYDHLDMSTIEHLSPQGTLFFVPLGIGAHLERWDVPDSQIFELEWWEVQKLGSLTIVCTPNRHYSGRGLFDYKATFGGIHLTGVTICSVHGVSSRWQALPGLGWRVSSLVSNRCGLPGLPRMAAVARRLRLSELRPRRRLALGRWPLHVSGVFDTQFGDGRYDLRSDADTLDDMVHRLLAVRHR